MNTKTVARPDSAKVVPMTAKTANISELLQPYGSGAIRFVGTEDAFYERHLVFDRAIDPKVASARDANDAACKLELVHVRLRSQELLLVRHSSPSIHSLVHTLVKLN